MLGNLSGAVSSNGFGPSNPNHFYAYLPHACGASLAGHGKSSLFCHSERSEESLFLFAGRSPGEIPRFARNDKKLRHFFRSLLRRSRAQGTRALMTGTIHTP